MTGLASWLGKIWASRILEKDRAKYKTQVESFLEDLRTCHNKELFVHRLQFEKEFETYKNLWKASLVFARVASKFRSIQVGAFEGPVEIQAELQKASKAFMDTIYDNRPFYAPQVYGVAKKILYLAQDVARDDDLSRQLEAKDSTTVKRTERILQISSDNEERLNQINALIDNLCVAIREQVWSTKNGP